MPESSLERLTGRVAPGTFIVLWSSGFIGAKFGLPHTEPFTFLSIRMAIAVALLAILVVFFASGLADAPVIGHNVIAGLLVHGCYLAGVFIAIANGLATELVALIVSLQPVLASTVANRILGERVLAAVGGPRARARRRLPRGQR